MTRLVKSVITTYIPGNPGNPGSPYVPPTPGYTSLEPVTTCSWTYPIEIITNKDGSYTILPGASQYACTTQTVAVYHPPTAGSPAVPYSPPTPAQISYSLNLGWNSYARTIGTLDLKSFIKYNVLIGSYGALMAVGVGNMEGAPLSNFQYGLLVDTGGIHIFEAGQVVATLPVSNAPGLELHVGRLSDGRIAYSAGNNVYISANNTYGVNEQLYVYGLLYAGGDEVDNAAFVAEALIQEAPASYMGGAGEIVVGSPQVAANMDGHGYFDVSIAAGVAWEGYGYLDVSLSSNITTVNTDTVMAGAGDMAGTVEVGGYGHAVLLPVQAFGGESTAGGFGTTVLPMFTARGGEAQFVPAQPTIGYTNLPFVTAWGFGVEVDYGTGNTTLPYVMVQGAEVEYGIGNTSLPNIVSLGYGILGPDQMQLISAGMSTATITQAINLVIVLNSAGQVSTTLSLTYAQLMTFLTTGLQTGSLSVLGTLGFTMNSNMQVSSLESIAGAVGADINSAGAVWVVNLETNASSQYDDYGFNSFFLRNGEYYGVANDGIYLLSGNDDAGVPIRAEIDFAKSNLGTANAKTVSEVYMGVNSKGILVLKAVYDGEVQYYQARMSNASMSNTRFEIGRGARGTYWQFSLLNQNGEDFSISDVTFMPVTLSRRM